MSSMKTAWEFVEEYYLNYYSSNEIAHNDDLSKLVNGQQEDGDRASKILTEEYGGDVNNPKILISVYIRENKGE